MHAAEVAQEPEHDENDQYEAENAAEPGPAIPVIIPEVQRGSLLTGTRDTRGCPTRGGDFAKRHPRACP